MSSIAILVNSRKCWTTLMKNNFFRCITLQHTLNLQLKKWKQLVPVEKGLGRTFFKMNQLDGEIKMFKGVADRFNGITVVSNDEPCTVQDLSSVLLESLNRWRMNNIRGVWFKVFLNHADWVPILAQNGFKFHHAKQEYVMMCKWLPTDGDECNIPCYAHTMVGVGAVVVNNKDEILVVREKYYSNQHWKLPGGYVEPGEDIVDAVIREVIEETAISTKFHSLVSFRHTHGVQFNCSDLYFIVSLTPLSEEIVKCDREIVACQWMKIKDFLSNPHVHKTNRQFVKTFLEYQSSGLQVNYEKNMHPTTKRQQCIFSASLTSKKSSLADGTQSDHPQENQLSKSYNVPSIS